MCAKGRKKTNSNYIEDLYFKDLKQCNPIPRYEEKKLIELAKNGDIKARNEVIKSNLRYVVTIANKYSKFGVPLNELISEGNLALFRALETFDNSKNIKFYCYAVWWIRQHIQYYIRKSNRINEKEVKENGKLINNNGNDDEYVNTFSDIASIKNINPDDFEYDFFDDISNDYTDDEVCDDDEYNDKENEELENEEIMFGDKAYISKVLNDLMGSLNSRERSIIRQYYGFDGDAKNLEEIGNNLDITQERVRQIKAISINKMRQEILLKPNLMNIYKI